MNDKAFHINNKPVCILITRIPEFMDAGERKYQDFIKIVNFYSMNIHVDIDKELLSFDIPELYDNRIRQICDEWLICKPDTQRVEFLIFTLDDTGKVVQDAVYAPLCDLRSFTKLSHEQTNETIKNECGETELYDDKGNRIETDGSKSTIELVMYRLEFHTRFCRTSTAFSLAQEYVDEYSVIMGYSSI